MRESMETKLLEQVEFYISPENLSVDESLAAAMDSNFYVSLQVLRKCPGIMALSMTPEDVKQAIKKSEKVMLSPNGLSVRPTVVTARDTVILRNVPGTEEPAVVEALFPADCGVSLVALERGIGDNWYCRFSSEEEASKAVTFIRTLKFKEKTLGARLKTRDLIVIAKVVDPYVSAPEWRPNYGMGTPVYPPGPIMPNYGPGGEYGRHYPRKPRRKGRMGKRTPGRGKRTDQPKPKPKQKPANFVVADFPALGPNGEPVKAQSGEAEVATATGDAALTGSEPLASLAPEEPVVKNGGKNTPQPKSWSDILKGGA